jgi:class 3 adenylate cyclase
MMQMDEQSAVAVHKHYLDVLTERVSFHKGDVLNDYGDGSLCVFSSTTDALRCAIGMQHQLQTDPKVPLRAGLHLGEIFFEHGKVFGDGVNVASRIQSLVLPIQFSFLHK